MSRPLRRKALLIGTETYQDGRFGALPSTRADVWQLRQVIEHRSIGAFASVRTVADPTADDMRFEIAEFLEDCGPDELALLYITGHGTRLSQSSGEFFFVAADTDFDRIADTGVGAGFVNERLEECWAPQKVAVLDCCRSGGFALGWRTGDGRSQRTAKSAEPIPLTSRGVYVIASSRAGEDSFSGADTAAGPEPSAFTAQVVEALRTGKAGRNSAGHVSVDDLFDYVNRRMRGLDARQIPVKSALAVDDRIILADCPQGAAPTLAPLTRKTSVSTPGGPGASGTGPALKSSTTAPAWPQLLDYYRKCVISDEVDAPLLEVADHGGSYVCLVGPERFLSGEVDDDGCVPVTPEAASLLDRATDQEAELWAGYPAVVLTGPRGGRPWRTPRFAPLLIRRVEAVLSESGAVRLKPYGPVLPHPGLARDWLGPEEAAELAATYRPTWHAGQHDRMAVDLNSLLRDEFELPCVQELRPDRPAERIDVHTPGDGARNASVLFLRSRDTMTTKRLLEDFASIVGKASQIPHTALAALLPEAAAVPRPPDENVRDIRLMTPLPANEAQLAVLRAALTRRLTVATGPPGTGKSQLVANLVATAAANGRSVLVASTNNQAVDEVWRRCERLVPGSVVRTGSRGGERDYRQQEAATLQRLLTTAPPVCTPLTALADLGLAADALDALRAELAATACTERRLREAGEDRDRYASKLRCPVTALAEALGPDEELIRWGRRAARAARARFFGRWRRSRLLHRLGLPAGASDAEACEAVAGFVDAECRWRTEEGHAEAARTDTELADAFGEAEAGVHASAAALLEGTVRSEARAGRQAISGLLQAADASRSDWPAVKAVLSHVRGWAVSSLSARRFPPDAGLFDLVIIDEASQCAIPHVIPLLFRARRALIIGDVMQLPHIATIGPEQEVAIRRDAGLRADWLEKHRLAYRRHSAFHAAERAAGGSMLLDEHYRCHPDIVAVSNDLFYDGRLTVLTDIRARPAVGRPAVTWVSVDGKAMRPRSGGSWLNPAEIDKASECVAYLLRHLPAEATIGVITPFKPQREALRERLPREERIRVGTVHTFQGGECDAMVFSLVAAEGMSPGAIGWVDRQLHLWNVAITRARSHLIVVGDSELWRGRGGIGEVLWAAGTREGERTADGDEQDDLLLRLYKELKAVPGASVQLGATVHGHRADARLEIGDQVTAVLLDRGAEEEADHARHLRLMLRRRELLAPLNGQGRAVRLPAWKLYDVGAVGETFGGDGL